MTTGGFTGQGLLEEEKILKLPSLTNTDAIEIGEIATILGNQRKVPIAIQVRIGDWIVFHASLQVIFFMPINATLFGRNSFMHS